MSRATRKSNSRRQVPPHEGPWLDVNQTAEYLAMKPRAVRELVSRGVLPSHRLGRSIRVNLRQLDRYLLNRRQATLDDVVEGKPAPTAFPLGPFLSAENAAEYLGLPSTQALNKRAQRMQVPFYRISERVKRFRLTELDLAFTDSPPLTCTKPSPNFTGDACLPGREEVAA